MRTHSPSFRRPDQPEPHLQASAAAIVPKESRNTLVFLLSTSWLPMLHPEAKEYYSKFTERRTMLWLQLVICLAIVIINIAVTAWAGTHYGIEGGVGTLFHGDCKLSQALNTAIHLVLNGLSTVLLGASNFCAQILVSPTRSEVDQAHRKSQWLDIEAQSLRNLRGIHWTRGVLWTTLVFSSGVLHLLWNSAVFATFPFVEYTTIVTTKDALDSKVSWDFPPNSTESQIFNEAHNYRALDKAQCVSTYMNTTSGAGNVIVVTDLANNSLTLNDGSSFLRSFELSSQDDWTTMQQWLCASTEDTQSQYCDPANMQPKAGNWTVEVGNSSAAVKYCLSEGVANMDSWCELHFGLDLMIAVCVMNGLKAICILYTLVWHLRWHGPFRKDDHLVTVGDAVASFLEKPDEYTRGRCMLSAQDFQDGSRKGAWPNDPRRWKKGRRVRLLALVSRGSWLCTVSFAIFFAAVAAVLLGVLLYAQNTHGEGIDIPSIVSRGIGQASSADIVGIFITPSSWQLWAVTVFANSWQLVLSVLYVLINTLVTRFCMAESWNNFATDDDHNSSNSGSTSSSPCDTLWSLLAKPRHWLHSFLSSPAGHAKFLRTSSPVGLQRGSYILSLPLRYGIPLAISSSLLQWLISQSVFVAQAAGYSFSGVRRPQSDASRVGYSTLGILLSLLFGLGLIGYVVGLGVRRLSVRLPPVASCSAAIAAAAQRPEEDGWAWVLPVRWGVVDAEEPGDVGRGVAVGHCALTSCKVQEPEDGKLYR